MAMRKFLGFVLGILTLSACSLPSQSLPTPFTFSTPNLTLTVMFAPTPTNTEPPPTLPPLPATSTPTSEIPITDTADPSASATPSPTTGIGPSPTVSPDRNRPNGAPVTIGFLSSPPTIDGDLSDWSATSQNINQATFGSANWSGINDASGTFRIAWDNSNLYLAVSVRDDTFVQTSSGSQMYLGDSLEIQFDANLASDFLSTLMSSDDYQIGLSPGNFGSLSPSAYRWYPLTQAGTLSSVTVRATQTTIGYDLEASLPWSTFGVTPSDGSKFGFAISISDNDQSASANQQSLVSNVSTRELEDPTSWGTLILEQ